MTEEREKYLKGLLKELITEQSKGEWTEEIVQEDVEYFFISLWEEFKDDS